MKSASMKAGLVIVVCLAIGNSGMGQLADQLWIGGTGNQQWQVDTNWNPGPFPNDPGRVDSDLTVITDVVGANLSVNLASNLNLDVGASDVTVAALTIGSASGAVTTNVTGSGGRMVFENFERNNNTDPDNVICAFNCGNALITSQGVAGSTNTISAVVAVNDGLHVAGTRNITLAGGIEERGTAASISAISPGLTVFVTGNIVTHNEPPEGATDDQPLGLNNVPQVPVATPNVAGTLQGTLDISGTITGSGRLHIGTQQAGVTLPLGTVILRAANTYSGRTFLGRGNTVVANNSAFGTGIIKQNGPANQVGYNLLSDNDNRVISNVMEFSQWQTVKGENSLEWAGIVYQDNARGWINMLPAGKQLTLSGGQYANHTEENPPQPGRTMTFDGTGRTVITGGLHNEWSTLTETANPGNFTGTMRFRGSGTIVVSGGNSTYLGNTLVEGSNLHFATNADMGATSRIDSIAGAVGVDAGIVGNATFLGKLNNSSNPITDGTAQANMVVWSRGGLMLGTAEYGTNLDFNSGNLANAANMSLAAHASGSTYTGTITPSTTIASGPNTYRLGGGSGALTLPNANQLTGSRNLRAENGGDVRLTNSNNYTGTTSIVAKYVTTLEEGAVRDTVGFTNVNSNGTTIPSDQKYVGTTLSVFSLANGGSASSIGNSSNAASNLVLQGGTLRYAGSGAASTDRLFTIGTGGATIDASGSGTVSFTNTSALAVATAPARTGNVNAFETGNSANDLSTIRNLTSTEDLHPGMPIMSPNIMDGQGIPANTTITRVLSSSAVLISNSIGAFAFHNNTQITFGAMPLRRLTLSGSNTGNNTFAPVIPNAADGGVVNLFKTGAGKWTISGNNTYTGTTTVDQGTLLINGNHTGSGLTTVAAGATLGGTGSINGGLTNNGIVAPGTSVGNFTVNGSVTMAENSRFAVELLGTTADRLIVNGNLDLSAAANFLDVIDLGKTGTSWIIATYTGSLTGTFETVTPGYTVDYGTLSNSQITLNFAGVGLNGDYNQDGKVDAADYVLWRKNPAAHGGAGGYDTWRTNFGNPPGSGSGAASELVASTSVPEPASALLIGIGLIGVVGRIRRR